MKKDFNKTKSPFNVEGREVCDTRLPFGRGGRKGGCKLLLFRGSSRRGGGALMLREEIQPSFFDGREKGNCGCRFIFRAKRGAEEGVGGEDHRHSGEKKEVTRLLYLWGGGEGDADPPSWSSWKERPTGLASR